MELVSSGPAACLWSTVLFVVILFAAGRIGGAFLGCLILPDASLDVQERNLFSVALGLIWITLSVLALGLLGCLNATYVCGWLMLSLLVSFGAPNNLFSLFSKKYA